MNFFYLVKHFTLFLPFFLRLNDNLSSINSIIFIPYKKHFYHQKDINPVKIDILSCKWTDCHKTTGYYCRKHY